MLNTEFQFPYGNSNLKARLPADNISVVLKRRQTKSLENPADAIINSLRFPTGSPPLLERLHKGDKVAVIVTDNTRACPDDKLLPPILAELAQKLPRESITIIVALGLHPPLNKEELIPESVK